MPYVLCKHCNKSHYKRPFDINKAKNVFCSHKCQSEYIKSIQKEGDCICFNCGRQFHTTPAYIRRTPGKRRFCSRECMWQERKTARPSKSTDDSGYIGVLGNKKRKRLHRYLIEQKLGRKLNRDEVVHHIDGNKLNNNLTNLVVMSLKEHSKLHQSIRLGGDTNR